MSGTFTVLLNFNGSNGANPFASVADVNGTLYGTTLNGGTAGDGTLFAYNIASGTTQTLISFKGTNGANPAASVIDVNGTLYGTTDNGGTANDGTLFAYNIASGTTQTLITFNGSNGANPLASVADVNDTLYGTTLNGGTAGDGTLFAYNIASGTTQTLISFKGTNGANPAASVIDVNGTLYGTTDNGGTTTADGSLGYGVLFSYTLSCFVSGARILTTRGEIPVEQIEEGTPVILADGRIVPVTWLGHRTVDLARHPHPETVRPVLIQAGAIGDGVPARDLLLSPDHAVALDGHLIPAKVLINGVTIRQVDRRIVTYYHVELPEHAVLWAEGTPCESYLETGNRNAFGNGGASAIALHPAFGPATPDWQTIRETRSCAPLVEAGPVVEAIRARLLSRADIATTADADLAITCQADGSIALISRSAIPGHLNPDPRDRRRLGVKIRSIRRADDTAIPLDHPDLTQGWHDPEPNGRWTDGHALIPASLAGDGRPGITLAATLAYPADRKPAVAAGHPLARPRCRDFPATSSRFP